MNSTTWWQRWYAAGRDSGGGSKGKLAEWKAGFLREIIDEFDIKDIFEIGCGDGMQIEACDYKIPYTGWDPSSVAIERCRELFKKDKTKAFIEEYEPIEADLALSLDVYYHLIEDEVAEEHIERLFDCALRYVIIYSTIDSARDLPGHMRHREPPEGVTSTVMNPVDDGGAAFYVYEL